MQIRRYADTQRLAARQSRNLSSWAAGRTPVSKFLPGFYLDGRCESAGPTGTDGRVAGTGAIEKIFF